MQAKKAELEEKAANLQEAVSQMSTKSENTEIALTERAVRGFCDEFDVT